MLGLLGDLVGEGVGDLDVEEPFRDRPDGIRLVDPVLTDHLLQRKFIIMAPRLYGYLIWAVGKVRGTSLL